MAVDAVLAFSALLVGFLLALIFFRHTSRRAAGSDASQKDTGNKEAYAVDRAQMAVEKLGDLAKNVATDVNSHNTLIGKISNELGGQGKSHSEREILNAVARIVEANGVLQSRLADAEKRIQAQAEEIRSQQSEARTDALTGLQNRRAFDSSLAESLERFEKQGLPCSLLMFDVDHFKQFNDKYGHQVGDEVLRSLGNTLRRIVKKNDMPCRYGGEEFALVMPNTTVQAARVVAARIRKSIESTAVQYEGKRYRVTASIGLAEVCPGEEAAQFIRRADEAVYASKEAGRNCCHWHDGNQCLPVEKSGRPRTVKSSDESAEAVSGDRVNRNGARLPDRSVFIDELRRRVSESNRFGVPLSVMHLRVQQQRQLEETYGEAVGNLVLDSVTSFIQSMLREMDLLGSYARGEFMVMLPGTTADDAERAAHRIEEAFSTCALPIGNSKLKLSICFGVAELKPGDDAKLMVERAIEIATMPEAASAMA